MTKYSTTNFGTMADVANAEYGKVFLHASHYSEIKTPVFLY